MAAVRLDEAWAEPFEAAPPPRPMSPPHSPPHSPPATPPRRRSARRSLGLDADVDAAACLASLEQVSSELRDLKALFSRQQAEQKTVLYVAIGVVIVLLLFTAHSYSRLQYASDCMLHWRK